MQIHHNEDPSAPPEDFEVIDDISYPNLLQNDNDLQNDSNNEFMQINIPAAIAAQLQFQKETQGNDEPDDEKEQSKAKNDVSESYMAEDVKYPETALYKTSSLCIWRQKENGKGIQFMMALDQRNNALSFFNGTRMQTDKSCMDAAIRAFDDQTGSKLDKDTLSQMRKLLATDKERKIFWKSEWKSILFYYQMNYDYDLVKDYKFKNSVDQKSDIRSLHWIDFEKIYNAVCITGNNVKISKHNKTKYPLSTYVIGMFLHEQNRSYLNKLHSLNGGNLSGMQPKTGSTVRNTMSKFDKIPSIIRLDVLNPITLNVVCCRWMDMQLSDIEDFQIFTSLISSVLPEIGRNFQLYYVENANFKKSKTQFLIDTNPSFERLRKRLCHENFTHFVTKICVLPTCIISDNFRGISLAFKSKDVCHKRLCAFNDDETMFKDEIEGGNNEDLNGSVNWKWQFMNDQNGFQDFAKKIDAKIEQNYLQGFTFATFGRNNVQYQVNFTKMIQKNLSSGKMRTLRRVPDFVESAMPKNNISVLQYKKWQFLDDDGWKDFDKEISRNLNSFKERISAFNMNYYRPNYYGYNGEFHSNHTMTVTIKKSKYLIDVRHYKQQNAKTCKIRRIRQENVYGSSQNLNDGNFGYANYQNMDFSGQNVAILHRWEWLDDDGSWKKYDENISKQIESACNSNIKKYFFVANENKNSYEISFLMMHQYNVQTGKQRKVRKISLNNNKNGHNYGKKVLEFGKIGGKKVANKLNRRVFGDTVKTLYCVVGDMVAFEVQKCNKLIRGTLGPFGAGLYFFDDADACRQMAENRSASNKGVLIECKVMIGKERDVSNMDDQAYDFMSMQRIGCDSVSRNLGFAKEYVVYNFDQVSVVKVEKYSQLKFLAKK